MYATPLCPVAMCCKHAVPDKHDRAGRVQVQPWVSERGPCCCAGGNAYFGQKPTHELMVRWTQLNALMPALQFSIAPWDLSEDTAKLCAQAVALRKKVSSTAPSDVHHTDSVKHQLYKCTFCTRRMSGLLAHLDPPLHGWASFLPGRYLGSAVCAEEGLRAGHGQAARAGRGGRLAAQVMGRLPALAEDDSLPHRSRGGCTRWRRRRRQR